MSNPSPLLVIQGATYTFETRCIQSSAITLLFYDHFLTLSKEVKLVWNGEHSKIWPRLFFFIARYAPIGAILGNSLGLYAFHWHTPHFCLGWLLYHCWTGLAFFASTQAISLIRTWILYRNHKVVVLNGVVVFGGLLAMGLIVGWGFRSLKVITQERLRLNGSICGPARLPSYVYLFWVPPIIMESFTFSLVLWKIVERRRGSLMPQGWLTTRFTEAMTQYSIIYFTLMLIIFTINLTIWKHLNFPAYELFIPFTFGLPSVVGNRILLEVRAMFIQNRHSSTTESIGLKEIQRPVILPTVPQSGYS